KETRRTSRCPARGAIDSIALLVALRPGAVALGGGYRRLRLALGQLELERVPMLEDVDRAIELHVLFLFGLGALRAGTLVALVGAGGRSRAPASGRILVILLLPVLEMMGQIRLVDFRVLVELGALLGQRCERFLGRLDIDVGCDSHRLDRAPGGSVVARRRQAQRGMIVERQYRLHRAFAEGLGAENYGALLILQRAGDDFAGARAAAIDQQHHRIINEVLLLVREIFLLLIFLASLRIYDQPAVEKIVRNLHRLVQQSARIVAQVEHNSLELAVVLRFELVDRLLDALARVLLEGGDADIAVAAVKHLRLDRLNLDDVARERHREQLGHGAPMKRQLDLAALGPAHPLDGLGQRHVLGEVVVDLDDLVAGLESGAIRRRVLDRRNYGERAILDGYFDSESAEAAAGLDLEVAVQVGRQVGAMRVERRQHAADGAVDQPFGRYRFNVVFLHDCEHAREGVELLVGVVRERLCSAHGDLLEDKETGGQADRQGDGPSVSFDH